MRILLWGEQTIHTVRLARSLLDRGHSVIAFDGCLLHENLANEFGKSCEFVRIRHSVVKPRRLEAVRRLNAFLRRRAISRALEHVQADVAHLNYLSHELVLFAVRDGERVPYVATAWGSDLNNEYFAKTSTEWRSVGEVVKRAAFITADSTELLQRCRDLAPERSIGDFRLVFWGVEEQFFRGDEVQRAAEEWRNRLQIPLGDFLILSPRQTRPQYNIELILEGFAKSKGSQKSWLIFKLHGSPEEQEFGHRLLARASDLGVASRVKLVERCAYRELAGLYRAATLGVSVPPVDGTPATFFEFMAVGTPLVVSGIPAYRDVVRHGHTGWCIDHLDSQGLGASFDKLLEEPATRQHIAETARRWVQHFASWEDSVQRFEDLYKSAVACRTGSCLSSAGRS